MCHVESNFTKKSENKRKKTAVYNVYTYYQINTLIDTNFQKIKTDVHTEITKTILVGTFPNTYK